MIENLMHPRASGINLTQRELLIINSYIDNLARQPNPDVANETRQQIFETGFVFRELTLPQHGEVQISAEALAQIEQSEKISSEFQGQPDLTVAELSKAASELMQSEAWRILYEDSIPSINGTGELTQDFARFYQIYERIAKYQNIDLPLLDENIREVVTTIFTRLPKYNAQSVYSILAASRAYGLFHRFCTQSFPQELETKIVRPDKKNLAQTIIASFLPHRVKKLQANIEKIDSKQLGPEIKWRAIDKETRINLAQEMFDHVKNFLTKNPDQKVIIVEPGGGNAELSSILAKQLSQDETTKDKAIIIVVEPSEQMVAEGRDKIASLSEKSSTAADGTLPIEFLTSTAETPLTLQLSLIKKAIHDHNQSILDRFGLTLAQAEKLIDFANGALILGGISTYTAGAISQEDGIDTTTCRVFTTLTQEVDSENGLIIINDFAATPPADLEQLDLEKLDPEHLDYLRKVADSFDETGLTAGLATVYGLWGANRGHDTRQIWQTLLKLYLETKGQVDLEINLRPFSLFPLPLHHRYLSIPGFMEATLRLKGTDTSGPLKL